jgi:hypothetical protein
MKYMPDPLMQLHLIKQKDITFLLWVSDLITGWFKIPTELIGGMVDMLNSPEDKFMVGFL